MNNIESTKTHVLKYDTRKKEGRNRLIFELRSADPKPSYHMIAQTFDISQERARQIVLRNWRDK